MKTFIIVLDAIIYVALFFALIEVYLKVNKIWKRKSDEQVAQSQSILGLGLSFFILITWTIKYVLIGEYTSIIDNGIYLIETLIMMLIGTGMFVKGNKGVSLFTLLKRAVHLERKEATYLLQSISGKKEALEIINILHQLAWIDNDLDDKELKLILEFAKAWNIDYSPESKELAEIPEEFADKLSSLRTSLSKYLETEPDKEQIAQLTDLLKTLISIDGHVSEEEDIIFDELNAMMSNSLSDGDNLSYYHVLIVPQTVSQGPLIKSLKPDAQEVHTSGGIAYSLEKYLSSKYAEQMCDTYRNKGLFTIVKEIQE